MSELLKEDVMTKKKKKVLLPSVNAIEWTLSSVQHISMGPNIS